jgi:protein-disulfide isomerase
VKEEVYGLRKSSLEQKINDTLLTQEAQKRGVSGRVLLDAEVRSKVPIITEAQALDFYNKNKERINGDFSTLKSSIMDYLQTTEQNRLEAAFAERLQKAANVQKFLTPPAPPVYDIATDDQPTRGNPSATVTVVEFTDYECPSCGTQYSVVERLMTEYSASVRFVVCDFPLAKHANAHKAAEAAEAAREQGKYWEYTAMLFRNQSSLEVPKLKEYATLLGLDRAKFDSGLDGNKFAANVDRDLLAGNQVGVSGTPSFFVNGRRVKDITYEGLKAAIEAALKLTPGR